MDECIDNFKTQLDLEVENIAFETYPNKHYALILKDEDLKFKLKQKIQQKQPIEPYTMINVSFNNELLIRDGFNELLISQKPFFEVTFTNSPIYIYGKYSKKSRSMSQTPMFIKDRLRSVADFVNDLKIFFLADQVKFIGSGREDCDVMMLGYRPFILEVVRPKANLSFKCLKLNLHDEVDISFLLRVNNLIKPIIHNSQDDKSKTYRALVYSKEKHKMIKLYELSGTVLQIEQETPIRVLHRRADLIRKKYIEILNFEVSGDYGILKIRAQAGAYIKEFVNGDFSRTKPSLSSISGTYMDCLELDVLDVEDLKIPDECVLYVVGIEK